MTVSVLGIITVSSISFQESYANHKICDTCINETEPQKYYRIEFEVYTDLRENGLVGNFLDKLSSDMETYTFRDIPITPHQVIDGVRSDMRVVTGALVFQSNQDAITVFGELQDILQSSQVRNKIEYASILLLENTHHYVNPLPDVILNQVVGGELNNLVSYDIIR